MRASNSRLAQGVVQVETRAFVENGELVCRYQRSLLIYRRGAGPYKDCGLLMCSSPHHLTVEGNKFLLRSIPRSGFKEIT